MSAVVASINLLLVVILLRYTKSATTSARAQAEVALRTLGELNDEKKLQREREFLRAESRLKDWGDRLVVLERAMDSVRFKADEWSPKPADWHEVIDVAIRACPVAEKVMELQQKLRALDIGLQSLAAAPLDNEQYFRMKDKLKGLVHETQPLLREIWEQMIETANRNALAVDFQRSVARSGSEARTS